MQYDFKFWINVGQQLKHSKWNFCTEWLTVRHTCPSTVYQTVECFVMCALDSTCEPADDSSFEMVTYMYMCMYGFAAHLRRWCACIIYWCGAGTLESLLVLYF